MNEEARPSDAVVTPDIRASLSQALANPEVLSRLSGLLSGLGQAAPDTGTEHEETADVITPAASEETSLHRDAAETGTDGASLLAALPPEMLAKLPRILATLQGGPSAETSSDAPASRASHRRALLKALRPYVSRSRQEVLDYLLRVSDISDLLQSR